MPLLYSWWTIVDQPRQNYWSAFNDLLLVKKCNVQAIGNMYITLVRWTKSPIDRMIWAWVWLIATDIKQTRSCVTRKQLYARTIFLSKMKKMYTLSTATTAQTQSLLDIEKHTPALSISTLQFFLFFFDMTNHLRDVDDGQEWREERSREVVAASLVDMCPIDECFMPLLTDCNTGLIVDYSGGQFEISGRSILDRM